MMKLVAWLFAIALIGATAAEAGRQCFTNCYWIGNQQYCSTQCY